MFVVGVFIYRPLLKCLGEKGVVAIGMIVRTAGFALLAWSPTQWWFMGISQLMVGGGNLMMPTTSSMLTTLISPSIFGKALGYSQAFQALARMVGPVIFGGIYDSVSHIMPFYINSVLSVVAALCIFAVPVPPRPVSTEAADTPSMDADEQKNVATLDETPTAQGCGLAIERGDALRNYFSEATLLFLVFMFFSDSFLGFKGWK